jgi:hypothetical protein
MLADKPGLFMKQLAESPGIGMRSGPFIMKHCTV